MKKHDFKIMFRLIKKAFIALLGFSGSLASMASVSDHTKCIPLNSQSCMNQPTLTGLNPTIYTQRLRYCPFPVNLDRCNYKL